ncbi:(deoxy)nucleoside triphosphate pyrophosphohydrolase [bacterium]|nr:(deoxy)nucleoside triphosphate pyrophosphohydrolase [candidate division CSSED10-310 bacterium]
MTRSRKLVAAGILERNGRYLLTRRRSFEHLPDAWEFPGGKLKEGEDPRAALRRELMEELGIEVEVGRCVEVIHYRYEEFDVLLMFFDCGITSGEPEPLESAGVKWLTPAEMSGIMMPPADVPVVRLLERRHALQ